MENNQIGDKKSPRNSKRYLDTKSLHQQTTEKINKLITKCSDIQGNISQSYDILSVKPNLILLESENNEGVFSKSPLFKLEKIRFKENVKHFIENQHSDKLHKIKSIILNEASPERELLSPDDLQTTEVANFISLNKRNFGEISVSQELKYAQPFKLKKNVTKINPIETVLNNIKTIMNPSAIKPYDFSSNTDKFSGNVLSNIQEHTPRNKFVKNELMKLWPPKVDDIERKRKKFLNLKIESILKQKRNHQKLSTFLGTDHDNKVSDKSKKSKKNKKNTFTGYLSS